MNKTEVRNIFPFIKNEIIYFNHASTGPVSSIVASRLSNLLKEKSETKIDDYNAFLNVYDETKTLLAEMINCSADRIAFIDNTSNGLNIIAQSINWKKGDRILLNDVEFPANIYPFLNIKRLGVEIDFVKSENGIVSAEQIINSIKPETKLISVSFVQFLSGYKIDLEKIGNYCRKNNVIFCVDAIQGIGAMKIDVKKYKIDFLSCGTQKWLLGMQGLAFIYVDEVFQRKMIPSNLGWLSVENAWNLLDYKLDLKTSANVFQSGTLNTFGIYAFNTSLKLFKDFGYDNIETDVLSNTNYFIHKLKCIGIECVLNNVVEEELAGIVTIKPENAAVIFKSLEQKKIICSLREGFIRFAPHFYNTHNEINKVVEELQKNLNIFKSKNKVKSMKWFYSFILISMVSFILFTTPSNAQTKKQEIRISPKAEVMQTVGFTDIQIVYSRPGVKGRTIWGKLVPFDAVWRAGANEATKISFSTDVVVEGKKLKGPYSFFAIPGKNEWTLIFNKAADQWGAFEYNESEDALRVKVKSEKAVWQEWLSYTINKASDTSAVIRLEWEKIKVPFKIEVKL